ncbi:MAG TPA: hypothetical protein VML55_18725 [Planctomycetaceae bacterium]|nr:hypothetical protein [Planctomycetaceae bacterium]
MLSDLLSGAASQRLDAAEALQSPPSNQKARRYRAAAIGLFLAGAGLFLAASLLYVFGTARTLADVLGWGGVISLQICVFCGVRYAVLNRSVSCSRDRLPVQSE